MSDWYSGDDSGEDVGWVDERWTESECIPASQLASCSPLSSDSNPLISIKGNSGDSAAQILTCGRNERILKLTDDRRS
jgi:hypothetical protein